MAEQNTGVPVYTYFYPLTTECPEREERAHFYGQELVDETQLAQDAQPLFDGHEQPATYCLGDVAVKNWDDTDPKAMEAQVGLAVENGVDGFIFDTFIGEKSGRKLHEVGDALDKAFLGHEHAKAARFATMAVLYSPRVVLPVPAILGFQEQDRNYDLTRGTAEAIIDTSARNYWDEENYIRMNGRPYLSVCMPEKRAIRPDEMSIPNMLEYMRDYSIKHYGVDPYLVGVYARASDIGTFQQQVTDAYTSYAFLADIEKRATHPVQDYNQLVDQRMKDWERIAANSGQPYVPSAVVGWDTSPRGAPGHRLEDVIDMYPFTPIVTGNNAPSFRRMLEGQLDFMLRHVPPAERYVPIMAWNEITEGSALLPKVRADGSLDTSYLDELKNFTTAVRQDQFAIAS